MNLNWITQESVSVGNVMLLHATNVAKTALVRKVANQLCGPNVARQQKTEHMTLRDSSLVLLLKNDGVYAKN